MGAFDGLDAIAMADLVRKREVSPTELVADAIARIEKHNPTLNAVINPRFEKALAEAKGPLPDGPFRGVPTLLKDLSQGLAGEPVYNGARFLKAIDWRLEKNSHVVDRMLKAGFIVLGKTTTPEFGTCMTAETLAHGITRNPWNTDHSVGGSSSGSAASVAAGFVPVSQASDGAGSIRMPASACGVVGLKATRGRVSNGPAIGETRGGAATSGCHSISVRDTAAFLDVIAGYEPGDPYTAPPPVRPYVEEVGRDPGKLRIGLLDHTLYPGLKVDPECAVAVHKAGRLLEGLGHSVEPAYPKALDEAVEFTDRFRRVLGMGVDFDVTSWERRLGRRLGEDDLEPWTLLLRSIGRQHSAADFLDCARWLHGFARRLAYWWSEDGFDILVSPVTTTPVRALGRFKDPEKGLAIMLDEMQFTPQCNLGGQPGLSLPLHSLADGTQIGVQFMAAFGREDLLVRLAAQCEAAQPWSRAPLN